jgi:alpha-1,3-glucosyltransferase
MMYQVFLGKLWLTPSYKSFLAALTLCGYASYMFGWHVHEKAILLVLVPLTFVFPIFVIAGLSTETSSSLLAADSHMHFRTFVIATVAGVYSLFPLLFTPAGKTELFFLLKCNTDE